MRQAFQQSRLWPFTSYVKTKLVDFEQNSFALLIAFIYARETFYRRVCSLCTFAMGSETVQRRENSKSWTSTQSGKLENRQKE